MSQVSIFKLPNECFYTIMKYIKRNCERERPLASVDIKYDDLISFAACCEAFGLLLSEWDTNLSFKLMKYVTLKTSNIHIDFEKTYARLKDATARDKEAHWSSLSHAIRSSGLTEVALRYAPESFYADHMDAFNTVLSQLQKKQNLRGLSINVPAYTLEGLGGLASLETLRLDIRMDIDDLIEICRCNKNLRVLEYMNNETGGKRLAAIAPHCQQLEELTLKMRPDCDASEYRNFAKIPKLQHLTIVGVHEKGTLQPLLEGFACNQSTILNRLFIVDASLDQNETQAMFEIETLTQVKCGFDDTQSIGLLSQLSNLDCLKIQSEQEFGTVSEHVLSILMKSKVNINIDLFKWSISYGATGELSIWMTDANANPTDCSPLSSLPGLTSYQVHGLPRIGLLQPILNGLALRQAPTLTDLLLKNITAEEIATVSEIASLSRLKCGFAETQNIELLARLPVLKKINDFMCAMPRIPPGPSGCSGLAPVTDTPKVLSVKRKT
ncbi:uncharacterized protein LOC117901567 [Drosophila subobscura]|uniref:uncharacterized protein LOC117901567 n=1 Tax=Drosophila subobscura TaxID=7241 RepID=UPI00155A2D63|nr:uncharacterized protein LOC117901567 [Drosophila subobscura]